MKRTTFAMIALRMGVLIAGFLLITGIVYAAGIWLTPFVDKADKVILAACNPDAYLPGADQFFRAISDYTNSLILAPVVSWLIARGLYRLFPRRKRILAGLLLAETFTIAVLAAFGQIWPNKTYIGANVLQVLMILAAFGLMAYLFYTLDDLAIRRLACVFWLVLLSGILTDYGGTRRLKDAVARPRPLSDAHKPWNEQLRVVPDEVLRGLNSYPSGHTAGTFALLAPLFWYVRDRRIRAGLFGWGVLQGVSRVYTAAHFPFCCVMGGFLGFSAGTLVFFALGGPALRQRPAPNPLDHRSTDEISLPA